MGKSQSNFQNRTIFGVPLIAGNVPLTGIPVIVPKSKHPDHFAGVGEMITKPKQYDSIRLRKR